MRTKLLALFILLAVVSTKAQTIDQLIEKYSTDKNFEFVSITKGLFSLTQWLGGGKIDADTKDVLSKVKTLRILTLSLSADPAVQKEFQKELDKVLKKGDFEQMMETRAKGDKSTVYGNTDSKGRAQLLIVAKNSDELSLIIMKGNLTHSDLEIIAK